MIEEIIKHTINSYLRENYRIGDGDDECYTRYIDVESELSNYNLSGKIIYCPCDNPSNSAFWKYFYKNFHDIGLLCLYATYVSDEPILWKYDGENIEKTPIASGKFQDNGNIIELCDIVATNPPFSSRQTERLLDMVKERGKDIITVGRKTFTSSDKVFGYIKNDELRNGYNDINRFMHPDGTENKHSAAWYTTLPVKRGDYKTGKKYDPNIYLKYDDYDAIEVPSVRDIPDDYDGLMGVPNNGGGFLRVHNPEQFEIDTKIRRPKINGKPVGGDRVLIKRKMKENRKRTIKLSENDLHNIVRKIIYEINLKNIPEQ